MHFRKYDIYINLGMKNKESSFFIILFQWFSQYEDKRYYVSTLNWVE